MFYQSEGLPFEYSFAIPMFFYWALISIYTVILIDSKMLNQKASLAIYIVTILFGGIILGGFPNALMPIQQILVIIAGKGIIESLLPLIIILSALLGISLVAGRVFCGFACPLGAIQELLSKISFKSTLQGQKKVKYRLEMSSKTTSIVQRIFFSVVVLLAVFFGFLLLQEFNPLLGSFFYNSPITISIIPLISMILISITSIFVYRPWCRFLCPFGAGSAMCSRFSRYKYKRTEDCTDCGLCEKICPTQQAATTSRKTECYFCNRCIEICPHDAIKFTD
ncbi:MAG: 4Fe-4S binding protein [Promethearchaeota archaeon]|jgi:polyferredoxin